MKAIETMEIKALIVSKSTCLLLKWPQLIFRLKFLKLRLKFCEFLRMSGHKFANKHFFKILSPAVS